MAGLHKIVPGVTSFVNGLSSVGVKGPFEVQLSGEAGGGSPMQSEVSKRSDTSRSRPATPMCSSPRASRA